MLNGLSNRRVSEELIPEVHWLTCTADYPELLMWDQLRGVMKDPDNNPFPGFQEGEINFPPTFKVSAGSFSGSTRSNQLTGEVRRLEVSKSDKPRLAP